MATENAFLASINGGRPHAAVAVPLTMVAGAAASGSCPIPPGSWLASIRAETATAFTGTPTNINLTVGNVASGAQLVAATDVKAQGHFTATIVAAYPAQALDSTLYFTATAVGGTSPAGTTTVVVSFYPPGN